MIQVNSNLIQVNSNLFQDIYNLLKEYYHNFLRIKYLHMVCIKKLSFIINILIDTFSGKDN